ncbi:hypothetical protein Tco_1546081 [Tanacetum coccineum]
MTSIPSLSSKAGNLSELRNVIAFWLGKWKVSCICSALPAILGYVRVTLRGSCGELDTQPTPPDEGVMVKLRS